ncbi:hypothetical protein J6590_053596 [Homalodisca vitripennis]|nr:hypothetical protein J6590_053596 [Homalodisca vitripennis]
MPASLGERCTLSNRKALASRPLDTDLATLPPDRPARPYAFAPIVFCATCKITPPPPTPLLTSSLFCKLTQPGLYNCAGVLRTVLNVFRNFTYDLLVFDSLFVEQNVVTSGNQRVEKGVKKKSDIAQDFGIPHPDTFKSENIKDRKRLREPENPDFQIQIRDKISLKSICVESGNINQHEANHWKTDLEEKIQDREEMDIFNVDETGLFLMHP